MRPIYKMFDGRHIDLSKILEISPARWIKHGSQNYVSFSIQFMLRDKAVDYDYEVNGWDGNDQFPFDDYHQRTEGLNWEQIQELLKEETLPRLQAEVDKVVEAWKLWLTEHR